ncbi:MAG: 5'/3'-nucleotidase SurE [Myxococcaceae bacterium]
MKPRILVSNDDGYQSEGIIALVEAMADIGDVWVVAPEAEQSAASHAISLHRPLRIREVKPRWWAVGGTPTDCSYLAIHHIMKDALPTLMVSGINHGANLADDVTYSGTVAAAMEARLLDVSAIAFSLVARPPFDFGPAARFAAALVRAAFAQATGAPFLLNVNIPAGEPRGYAITKLGKHSYGAGVVDAKDPRGRTYFWIGGNEYEHQDIPGSDCNAIFDERKVSVTPLQLDLTDEDLLTPLRQWRLEGFSR